MSVELERESHTVRSHAPVEAQDPGDGLESVPTLVTRRAESDEAETLVLSGAQLDALLSATSAE
ncbi:MAG: hypothetical protein JNL38_18100 [Myxococcales bacterium]|jgi:hypothetical protein|nr:hypothetical protein [Myxococcales bacterium]